MEKRIIIEGKMQKNKAMKIIMCVFIIMCVLMICEFFLLNYDPFFMIGCVLDIFIIIGLRYSKEKYGEM